MGRFVLLVCILARVTTISPAQTITETFGTGANVFTMDFVQIGNPGNAADTTGAPNPAGAVPYTYNLGKYEVSRDMITKANSEGNSGITMSDMSNFGGNGVNRPATGITWFEAAKFVNWLNTSTGGTAAYKFDGSGNFQLWSAGDAGYNANNMFRNTLAKYVIASTDEWYKGAYGKADGSWSNFPNGSDSAPTAVASGTAVNTAVYNQSFGTGPADITSAGGLSAYGTIGQGGNVWEWSETAYNGSSSTADEHRALRGGSWYYIVGSLDASYSLAIDFPKSESFDYGIRVAMIPEPSSLSLLALGSFLMALRTRRHS